MLVIQILAKAIFNSVLYIICHIPNKYIHCIVLILKIWWSTRKIKSPVLFSRYMGSDIMNKWINKWTNCEGSYKEHKRRWCARECLSKLFLIGWSVCVCKDTAKNEYEHIQDFGSNNRKTYIKKKKTHVEA